MSVADGLAPFISVVIFLVIIVLVLWVFLPFAVFGLKPLVSQLLAESKITNTLLRPLVSQLLAESKITNSLLAQLVSDAEDLRSAAEAKRLLDRSPLPAAVRRNPDRA